MKSRGQTHKEAEDDDDGEERQMRTLVIIIITSQRMVIKDFKMSNRKDAELS